MPPFIWTKDPSQTVVDFEVRHVAPEAGALLLWAISCVDALHYLADIDESYSSSRSLPATHKPDVVDVAHARWATSSCITSLDLCAAAFGRAFCKHSGPQELDLGHFDPSRHSKKQQPLRALLPETALNWITGVYDSPDFTIIKTARDSLTHRRLARHLYASIGSRAPDPRLDLQIGTTRCPVGEIVIRARDLATTHVSDLINQLPQL